MRLRNSCAFVIILHVCLTQIWKISFFSLVVLIGLMVMAPVPCTITKTLALTFPWRSPRSRSVFTLAWHGCSSLTTGCELPTRLSLTCFREESGSLYQTENKHFPRAEQSRLPWLGTLPIAPVTGKSQDPGTVKLGLQSVGWTPACPRPTARHWSCNPPNYQSREFKSILHFTMAPNSVPTKKRKAT